MSDSEELPGLSATPDPFVRLLTKRDTERVRDLWKRRFGGLDEHIDDWFTESLTGPNEFCLVAVDMNEVVGFGFASIAGQDFTRAYLGIDDVGLEDRYERSHISSWECVCVLHLCVVDESHEGQGLARRLTAMRLGRARSEGAEGAVAISWLKDGRDSTAHLESAGLKPFETVEEYYAAGEPRQTCPQCDGICRCDARLYAASFGGIR